MNATADRILDAGQDLIQTGGFSAMSFQDIASEVGIRKPSICLLYTSDAADE